GPMPRHRSRQVGAALLVLGSAAWLPGKAAMASPPTSGPADRSGGPAPNLAVEGGLLLALPAALPTGLSSGIEASALLGRGLVWGAGVSGSTATEYAPQFAVTHGELRLRGGPVLSRRAGRAALSVRLAAGATLVHETRARDQASRAGLTGAAAEQTAWSLLPA